MSHAAQVARARRAEANEKRRRDEALCAWDFLTWGDERGTHADICIRPAGLVCSRDYYPGEAPDPKLYKDTELGTLFGYNTRAAWQLAGWNLKGRDTL